MRETDAPCESLGPQAVAEAGAEVSVAERMSASAREAGCSDSVIAESNDRLRDILVEQGRLDEGIALDDAMTQDSYTFAGNVSSQVGGADLSDEREEKPTDKEHAMAAAAKVRDWKGALAKMDYDQRVDATLECFSRRRPFTEVMRNLLEYCRTERTLEETEAHIEAHPNFEHNSQSAHQYIFFMQRTGALEELEYDSDGMVITDDMRHELEELGATAEELEDLCVEWHYRTTDVGKEALRRDDPIQKFKELIPQKISRRATYERLLSFCKEPHSMDEIFRFMQGDPGLEINAQGIMGCQPSAYVSHLEDAGVLVWRGGSWRLSKAGEAIVQIIENA